MLGYFLVSLGLIAFLIGFFFMAKSEGQKECAEQPATTENNFKGGIAGLVIGGTFILIGSIVLSIMSSKRSNSYDNTNY